MAYRKALAWLGHSSSQMLDLYYHLHDEDSQYAMVALANFSVVDGHFGSQYSTFEGNLRAMGQSKIDKTLQVPEAKELTTSLSNITERPGFEPGVRFYPYDGLANRYLQPLGHLSGSGSASLAIACA